MCGYHSVKIKLSVFVYPVGPEDRTGAPLREIKLFLLVKPI
jgi:hypothetical protein